MARTDKTRSEVIRWNDRLKKEEGMKIRQARDIKAGRNNLKMMVIGFAIAVILNILLHVLHPMIGW